MPKLRAGECTGQGQGTAKEPVWLGYREAESELRGRPDPTGPTRNCKDLTLTLSEVVATEGF